MKKFLLAICLVFALVLPASAFPPIPMGIWDDSVLEVDFDCTNSPTDNYILSYDAATGGFTWVDAGGSGDITAVGPGYATGGAFTDGVASTGTTMFIWEGTSADGNEFSLIAPSANPGSDIDITFPDATGTLLVRQPATGAGTVSKTIVIPKIWVQGTGVLANGTTNVVVNYIDADPAADWSDADTDFVTSTNSSYYKEGSTSMKLAIGDSASANDRTFNGLSSEDWSDKENVGVWIYSTVALSAGDFDFRISDGTQGDSDVDIPAVAADTWTWTIINISGVDNANLDDVDEISLVMKVDKGAADIYFDFMAKWDTDDETTLDQDITEDGMISAIYQTSADGNAHDWDNLTEYTDYFINYGSPGEIVPITNRSVDAHLFIYAYE